MSRKVRRAPVFAALVFATACGGATFAGDPADASIFAADIGRFWDAYDSAFAPGVPSSGRPGVFQRLYFDPGSRGLDAFQEKRLGDAARLARTVEAASSYYEAIRPNTLALTRPDAVESLNDVYRAMDALYSRARFPDTYLMIGRLSTGGTISDEGLLLGVEMFARDSATPVDELTPWARAVTRDTRFLRAVLAHELVHIQQENRPGDGDALLAFSISEGMADFVGELLTGLNVNEHLFEFADTVETELWDEFQADMNRSDLSGWLFQGTPDARGRPADLGYYFGYRISASFFERTANREQAIREMFAVSDYLDFLRRSGYNGGR